jgi:hypothetical protein
MLFGITQKRKKRYVYSGIRDINNDKKFHVQLVKIITFWILFIPVLRLEILELDIL